MNTDNGADQPGEPPAPPEPASNFGVLPEPPADSAPQLADEGAGGSDDESGDEDASGADTEQSEPESKQASPELLEELIREHSAAVYRVAIFIVRDNALAEDVVQDTMIRVWQNYGSFRGDSPIRGWILRIAHNTAVSKLRKIKDETWDPATLPDSVGKANVERTVEGREDLVTLGKAMEGLDDLSRSIVVLREVEGLAYEEIAEALEITLPTVKTRLLRARRTLQGALQEAGQ